MSAQAIAFKPEDTSKQVEGGTIDTINARVSGKSWKLAQKATKRTQMPRSLRTSWAQKVEARKRHQMAKELEKQLKDEKAAEKQVGDDMHITRKREITEERRKIKEEKERLEQLAAKMSANRLKRLRKKQGNKKTN